ncbi:Uncharacterized conserved protein, DUF983 family [Sphingomonas guangdongensis]|uniref:Uncharacterized conserved protein, DUF983 family n=1 Tax=Sphingomonas guangdongensis TaxID=1141890 RepID=A0A285QCC6_9SPHN|nr:DUF983 domain-containing protein [Sphingomonas guangdongensis]SOB79590.1 Uncharacterized conserved protein, DUF983 family [Sphingomonas guangdongensis]
MDEAGGVAPAAPTIVQAGLKGLCPRCGAQTLFAGVAHFATSCRACGLDFAGFNVGDGPAAFLTLGIGTIVTVLALALDFAVRPPLWLHLMVWPLVTLGAVIGGLRVAKAALLAAEYRNAAREGRISE